MGTDHRPPTAAAIAGGLAVVYLVWGSTYLGIRYAVETMPPFIAAAARFLMCGAGMYAVSRFRGAPKPTRRQWRNAAAAGVLLFVGGNGGVTFSQWLGVPSGVAALVVATVPAWLAVFDWAAVSGRRPAGLVFAGIALGLCGVALLTVAGHSAGGLHFLGAWLIVAASASWAAGSLFARAADVPRSPVLLTGMEMLAGGAGLLLASVTTGELVRFDPDLVTQRSALAFGYLCLAGMVALPVYSWLMSVAPPALVGTYAFVNPVVAVLLGWAIEGEHVSEYTGAAAGLVVAGVALITLGKPRTS